MAIEDTVSIIQLINLYGLAMDTQRWDLFDSIFTSDVDADFGPPSQWHDLASFKSDFASFHKLFDSTQHAMSNHIVNVQGDTAQAFTYGNWRLIRKGVPGGDLWEGTGWYEDDLLRVPAGWRIRRRVCKVVWWGGNPVVQTASPDIKFELQLISLRGEAEAGRVGMLKAIAAG